jgi:autotransporter translocation and assembly factor TamB
VGVPAAEARERVRGGSFTTGSAGEVSTAEALAVLAGQNRQIVREVRRFTGLPIDTLQIDPPSTRTGATESDPRFTVGGRVNPDLSVTYSRGVSSGAQEVHLEYRLATNLALVAQWSDEQSFGGGLKFRFRFR